MYNSCKCVPFQFTHQHTITIKPRIPFKSRITTDHQIFRPSENCIENKNRCSSYNSFPAYGIFSRDIRVVTCDVQICRQNRESFSKHSGSPTKLANRKMPNWFQMLALFRVMYTIEFAIGKSVYWGHLGEIPRATWSVSFFPVFAHFIVFCVDSFKHPMIFAIHV